MSEAAPWVGILLGVLGSIAVTIWQASRVVAKVETLTEKTKDLQGSVGELTTQYVDLNARLQVVERKLAPFVDPGESPLTRRR